MGRGPPRPLRPPRIASPSGTVAELIAPEEDGGMGLSKRKAAEVFGVSDVTVGRDLASATNVAPVPDNLVFSNENAANVARPMSPTIPVKTSGTRQRLMWTRLGS